MRKYIYLGIILFIISLAIGYFLGNDMFLGVDFEQTNEINNVENNTNITNQVLPTMSREIKILPTTNLGLKRKHMGCMHTSFEFVDLPTELINKTEDEVRKLYKEWEIEEFYENKVILYKEVEGICDEHFYITLGEEFIEIYKIVDEKENKILYKTTDVRRNYLTDEDIEKLEKGIKLYGKDRLSSAIEDFE